MTVYEFLLHAARSYSGVVNGGKTEEIMIPFLLSVEVTNEEV